MDYNSDIISNIFPYKEMSLCTHFTNLCCQLQIYFKPDYPIVLRYGVASLGDIKLGIAPIPDS